jgi:hypothetical protein
VVLDGNVPVEVDIPATDWSMSGKRGRNGPGVLLGFDVMSRGFPNATESTFEVSFLAAI